MVFIGQDNYWGDLRQCGTLFAFHPVIDIFVTVLIKWKLITINFSILKVAYRQIERVTIKNHKNK